MLASSWTSPKTIKGRPSGIEGRGLFAVAPIATGELVAIKGGHIIDRATLDANAALIGDSYIQIADDAFLAPLEPEEVEPVMLFLNHSCEPNVGVRGNVLFVAMRPIAPGEELTIDYAMIDDEDYELPCRCGHANCRGTIGGRDWRRPELQARYGSYFSAYLLAKMR
ncbi:MAG TPA: SET domain-containing protein-lysine N-methyltransferase [Dehalococcoidia bacterium]|jgi:hypothetical protein